MISSRPRLKVHLILVLLAFVTLVSSCAQAKVTAPPSGSQRVSVHGGTDVPSSINETCTTDDTKALGAWLYSLHQGTTADPTKVDFGMGCYQVDGTLLLRGFQNFVFTGGTFEQLAVDDVAMGDWSGVGPDRPAYCGSSGYTRDKTDFYTLDKFDLMWDVEGGCGIIFKNMTIDGANTEATSGHYSTEQDTAISFYGTQRALVDNVTIRNPLGDYVDVTGLHEVDGEATSTPGTDITVENCHLSGSGRQGLSVILGERIAFVHDTIYSAHATVFDIEEDFPAPAPEYDIDIADNTIVGFHYAYVLSAQTGAVVERLQFSGNKMIDGGQMRIVIVDKIMGDNIRIDDNYASAVSTASDGAQPAIRIQNILGSTIEIDNNTVPNDKAGFAWLPSGSLVCENGPGTSVCPSKSPVTPPALAALP